MKTNNTGIPDIYLKAIVVVATSIAYLPALKCDFTNWDDNIFVTANVLIRSFTWENIKIWFTVPFQGQLQPLVLLSLALDYAIDKYNPMVFHASNLLIHLLNSMLVYLFIKKIFRNQLLSFFTALFFAIHPVNVESVAWITERKNVLYTLFFFASLNLYIDYTINKSKKYYYASLAVFILALLSKSAAVTLPLVLLIIDHQKKRNLVNSEIISEKIPFFILSLFIGIYTIIVHFEFGALANNSGYTIIERILISARSIVFYLGQIILPVNLSPYYPLPDNLDVNTAAMIVLFVSTYTLFIGLIVFAAIRGIKILFFGLVFFGINIVLFLIPAGVPAIAADRYLYISGIGIFLILGSALVWLIEQHKMLKYAALMILLIIFTLLTIKTHQQSHVWQNSITLWEHIINTTGETSFSLFKRGIAYTQTGDHERAMNDLDQSILLNPSYGPPYESRGYLYLIENKLQEAERDFSKALTINPESIYALQNLGLINYKTGKFETALTYLDLCIAKNKANAYALKTRAKVYLSRKQVDHACADLRKALSLGLSPENEKEALDLKSNYCN